MPVPSSGIIVVDKPTSTASYSKNNATNINNTVNTKPQQQHHLHHHHHPPHNYHPQHQFQRHNQLQPKHQQQQQHQTPHVQYYEYYDANENQQLSSQQQEQQQLQQEKQHPATINVDGSVSFGLAQSQHPVGKQQQLVDHKVQTTTLYSTAASAPLTTVTTTKQQNLLKPSIKTASMPQTNKQQQHQQQQQQQQQIIQHTSHTTTINASAASSNQLHQQHVQQVHLANSTTIQHHHHHQHFNQQQQAQSSQQQAHMIQVSEEYLEQAQVQTHSHSATSANMMISATGEVIQQQQIFKIVSTDAATGNMIIDTSGSNQNTNASTASKVLLGNLTVLSKQQGAAAAVTGQQPSPTATAQTINFVNAKHVYTASPASNAAAAAALGKHQKLSVASTSLGGSLKNSPLKQTTNSQQYVQQITGGLGGQQKLQITTGNRNAQMLATTTRVHTASGAANNMNHTGVISNTPNTAQTMVLQQPHKFVTTNSTITKSTLGPGGNVIKKTTGTLRMSNNNNTTAKLINNLHGTQGVKTFITQTTANAALQHQQQQNIPHQQQLASVQQQQQQQHHVKGGGKSKFVKQYTNAIINSAGAVAIATLPHQQQQQHNQNSSLITNQQQHHQQQQLQPTPSGYINHHHKATTGPVVGGNTTKVNKINSKYATANVAAQLPPGTQLHQKMTLSQTSAQTQQQFQPSSSNNSNIKFVNAQGTIIQQQQQSPQPMTPQKIHIKQQQHHPQYQSLQNYETVDGASGNGGNNHLFATQQQHQAAASAAAAASNAAAATSHTMLSDDIMMVNGTQMTDELSARILQSMSQKSFNNQRYQQHQHLVQKSPSGNNMLPPPPSANNANVSHTHLQNATTTNNHSNILLSPREYTLYPPTAIVATQQQQSPSSQLHTQPSQSSPNHYSSATSVAAGSLSSSSTTNYMTVSNSMTTITPHSGTVGGGGSTVAVGIPVAAVSSSSSRQAQSAPNSRSQSMERKLHESSMSRKSTEYYKANNTSNHNSLRGSHSNLAATAAAQNAHTGPGNIATSSSSLSSSAMLPSSVPSALMGMQAISTSSLPPRQPSLPPQAASVEPQAQVIHLQASKTLPGANTSSNDNDDIIGEEMRPVPVDTEDIRLQILHAVLLDHTYANPMPLELPTTFAVQLPPPTHVNASSMVAVGNCLSAQSSQQHQWSLGGIGAVAATTGPVANNGAPGGVSTSNYTMYSSQLARLQQDDDAYSAISNSSRLVVGDIDPGEETETAPEAEAEDDSITRCICDLTHDDGYMICCDKCCAWQHVDCMGIDRQNIPDEYLCELCQPRPVDKARARALQVQKRKEQTQLMLAQAAAAANTMGAAGSASGTGGAGGVGGVANLLPNDVLTAQQRLSAGVGVGFSLTGSGQGDAPGGGLQHLSPGGNNFKKGSKVLKKVKESVSGKKSKKADKMAAGTSASTSKAARKDTKKNTKRKKATHEGGSTAGMTAAEKHAANLRQWIENYELAVTNHYSPELRARLHAITKQPSLLHNIINTENPALKEFSTGNLENRATTVPHAGGKILISNLDIGPNSPICELRGKYMLTTQYKTQNASMNMNTPPPNNYHMASYKPHKTPGPFIFFYKLQGVEVMTATQQGTSHTATTTTTTLNPDGTYTTTTTTLPAQLSPPPTYLKGPEICVDTRTYGNEARFVRRSCRPNAEIQHLFEKGTIHLFIVALTDIRASTEITVRHEPHDLLAVENKKSNAMVIQPTSTPCACGLSKDCIFGPPLPQLPPAAKSNTGRKSLALNGGGSSSSATGTLTAKQRKANQQNLNRNRSTSSSGDSNMGGGVTPLAMTPTPPVTVALGLNSPNHLLVGPKINKTAVINTNNPTVLLPITASCNSNLSNASSTSSTLTSIVQDSGICTSSSSPSVSIPSPTQHMHSPIQQTPQQHQQQQQHHLKPAQILPQQQQQQLMQSLPTPLILATDMPQQHQQPALIQSPQAQPIQLMPQQLPHQQQPPQQQIFSVLPQAVAPSNIPGIEIDQQQEQRPPQGTLFLANQPMHQQQQQQHQLLIPPAIQQPQLLAPAPITSIVVEPSQDATMAASALQSLNTSQPEGNAAPTVNSPVVQQTQVVALHAVAVNPEPPALSTENQTLAEPQASASVSSHCSSPCSTSSPLQHKSPQKNNQATSHQNNQSHAGRKTPAKHSRTTSFSEDNEHLPTEENVSAATPNSSSTPKEKPKLSREDRKMEAILRAIEKMERSHRKQEQTKTKKQNTSSHNTTPTSPNKTLDSADSSTGASSKRSNSQSAGGPTRTKKKRKAGNRGTTHNNQRKRRQSRMNSQESIDGSGPHENDAITSESDGCAALHSPPIQTVAALKDSTKEFSPAANAACPSESATNNVDQAAGLLMAFANPSQVAPSLEPPQSPQRPAQYMISSSSPNDATASPPATPPSHVSSACLLIEAAVGPLETNLGANTDDITNAEFKYPLQAKTKKHLMNNWLHQTEEETAGIRVPETVEQTTASSHLVTGGLDSLVQAAMNDLKQAQTEVVEEPQPQNLSIVAQRVEEFIHLTEGVPPGRSPSPTKHSYEYEQQQQQPQQQQKQQQQLQHTQPELYAISTPAVDLSLRNHTVPTANPTPSTKNFNLPLQVSTCSNNSSVKKRWLRQAISEESHEESQSNYSMSPSPATTPVIAVNSFVNSASQQLVAPSASTSPALTNHVPNGFTTPLKKRRLLLAGKDDMLEETAGQSSGDLNINTPQSPSPQAEEQDTVSSGECEEKLSVAQSQPPLQELQEDVDVDVEKCELPDLSLQGQQFAPSAGSDFGQDVDITSTPMERELIKTEVVTKHEPVEEALKKENTEQNMAPCPQRHDSAAEFNDQEDDVDILRSPSPGREMIKAEDNLVKIEPEDTSGNDDVKIDVEREESIAADDVMASQLKHEYKEDVSQPNAEIKLECMEVKQESKEEGDRKINTNSTLLDITKKETPEIVAKHESFRRVKEEELPEGVFEPNPKRFKLEDDSKPQAELTVMTKEEKVETQGEEKPLGDDVKQEVVTAAGAVDNVTATMETLPSETVETSTNNTVVTTANSFSSVDSATPPISVESQPAATTSETAAAVSQRSKALSEDDLHVRLHNFHRENILFLQSRNKKSKSSNSNSSSSSTSATGSNGADHPKHKNNTSSTANHHHHHHNDGKEKADKSEKLSGKHKNASSLSSSGSSKKLKLHKRERTTSSSSSSHKNAISQLSSASATSTPPPTATKTAVNSSTNSLASSSSSSSSISSSKKVKSLKKSSSGSSTSSTNSSSSSSIQNSYPTSTTADKDKNQRQRTTSNSSSTTPNVTGSSAVMPQSKKRQLNFELELTKDMHLLNSVPTTTTKHKRSVEESQSHSSVKKSKKESSSNGREEQKNGTNKVHKLSAVAVNIDREKEREKDKEKKSMQVTSSSSPKPTPSPASAVNVSQSEEVKGAQHAAAHSAAVAAASNYTILREHPTLPHFNNVVVTPMATTALQPPSSNLLLPPTAVVATTTAQPQPLPPPAAQNIPNHVIQNVTPTQPPPLPPTPPPGGMSSPVSVAAANSGSHLPFYNTIYGKLLDNHTPGTASTPTAPAALITPSSAAAPGSLSDFLDTKVKSYNTLGGYVSHTALFGLNNSKDTTTIAKDTTTEMAAPQVPPAVPAAAASSLTSSLSSTATTSPNVTALKILTKTASHDPRLNPQLTAPEPPPQPKRKLSINEYRKRMQQSTSHESTSSNSLASTPTTPPITLETSITAGTGAVVINKCTLNSPERLTQSVDSQIQKEIMSSSNVFDSLNSSNSSTSNSSLNDSLLKSSSFVEEDSTKGQFNAAPTLLEKQQESLCARLKSLKEKQGLSSALGVVGGNRSRFSSFSESMGSGEFALRKDDDDLELLGSKRNHSISSSIGAGDLLDNCLEEISSTSTSMSSSREPSPERYTSTNHQRHSKHLLTASATTTMATTSSSAITSSGHLKAQQHHHHNNGDKTTKPTTDDLERKKIVDTA